MRGLKKNNPEYEQTAKPRRLCLFLGNDSHLGHIRVAVDVDMPYNRSCEIGPRSLRLPVKLLKAFVHLGVGMHDREVFVCSKIHIWFQRFTIICSSDILCCFLTKKMHTLHILCVVPASRVDALGC